MEIQKASSVCPDSVTSALVHDGHGSHHWRSAVRALRSTGRRQTRAAFRFSVSNVVSANKQIDAAIHQSSNLFEVRLDQLVKSDSPKGRIALRWETATQCCLPDRSLRPQNRRSGRVLLP